MKKRAAIVGTFLFFVFIVGWVSCGETIDTSGGDKTVPGEDGGAPGGGDGDADTDTDTDTDTDSDSDLDADADADTDGGFEECAESVAQAENLSKPVDIVWFIDNSGSMDEELFWVKIKINNEFATFFNTSGLDYRLVLISDQGTEENQITVPDPLGSDAAHFLHIDEVVNSHDGLEKIIGTYPQWQDFIREDSLKVFIATTDDNSDMTAAEFNAAIGALTDPGFPDGFVFHGIIACCNPLMGCVNGAIVGAGPGYVYKTLIDTTGGVQGDLCSNNWTPIFNELAQAVLESVISCNYTIPEPDNGEEIDPAKVNVTWEVPDGGPHTIPKADGPDDCSDNAWYYDDEDDPTELILCPETCDNIQGIEDVAVNVVFGCDTVVDVD